MASEVLPPRALALFRTMVPGDQLHGLRVLRRLRAEGHRGPVLEQAALLHDVGKAGAGLTLAHRSLAVILERIAPGILQRLAGRTSRGWRRPFCAHMHHAEIGATRAAEAGCDPAVVTLIRHHDASTLPEDSATWHDDLQALRRADGLE